ncbi:MAG: restriction endonuclease subunit S [Dokdonella sp.]
MSRDLPSGWVYAQIPDLIGARGVFNDGDWVESKDQDPDGDVRLIQLADIGDGHYVNKSNRFLTKSKAEDLKCTFLSKGDVLLARMPDPLGRACLFPGDPKRSVTVVDVCVIRGEPTHIDHAWLMHFINSPALRMKINALQSGSTRKRISRGNLSTIPLPVPPRAEQTRIVEKLEELLPDLDAGVAELKAAQRKLAQYRQSLLKAAVEGALTVDWRDTRANTTTPQETGAGLLQRILTERRARWEAKQLAKFTEQGKTPPKGWRSKYEEPVEPETINLPALPDKWVWASLGQLTESLSSGSRDWAPYYDRGTCTFVMAQNVRPWRPHFSFRQPVDPPEGDRDRARSLIEMDDLLLTIVGANTGQACRVAEKIEDHFVCQSVALIRLTDSSLSEFVNAVLNSPEHGQKQFREMNYGAGRPHLSFEQVESVLVPLPPLAEQQEILRQFDLALAATEDATAQLRNAGRYAAAQRKNILKTAFAGQLVPQDPNDEPASVLLERIRAERAAHGSTGTKRGRTPRKTA